jgi:hypothetical protein
MSISDKNHLEKILFPFAVMQNKEYRKIYRLKDKKLHTTEGN